LIVNFLLISSSLASGSLKLECNYDTIFDLDLWPEFSYCQIGSIDLSESFRAVEYSFSGTPEQKSAATAVNFFRPSQIDFVPKGILNDFPQLNGIMIRGCQSLKTVKNDLFDEDFGAIQYLDLCCNKIETVEAKAFQHLPKLKRINLNANQVRSLPHQILKNNPEIIAILLSGNKINSITPDFFKNLNKLQWVDFGGNQCTRKNFGCPTGSCLIIQKKMNSDLATCYSNWR
jgi:Leucine-rich repeat (LRR) protein